MDIKTTETRVQSEPKKRRAHVEFRVALILVIAFVLMSMYLVLQIRDADRAEDREKAAYIELESLNEKIPAQKSEAAVISEKISSLKAELAGLQENYEKLKEQYDKAESVVSARNQASQEYSDLTVRIRAGEKTLEELQSERDQLLIVIQDTRRGVNHGCWRIRLPTTSDSFDSRSHPTNHLLSTLAMQA